MPEKELFIVGVGASAGGMEALNYFLSPIKGKENCAIVILQHLNPDYKSNLVPLLQKTCEWEILEIKNEMQPVTSKVYLVPPKMDLGFQKGKFILKKKPKRRIGPSIDHFFINLAEEKKMMAIGVILSGSGNDGSTGIEAIQQNGGYVICQVPSSASSRGMPQSAIDTRHYDILLKPMNIFQEIKRYIRNYRVINQEKREKEGRKDSTDLILDMLTEKTGTHFSRYKRNTITRRINKRMDILEIGHLDDYFLYIQRRPKELDYLLENLLIGVTEFFRDQEAFDSLRSHLLNNNNFKKDRKSFRIWSVGCATGEEPYSLAIMMLELMENKFPSYNLQIFATDIHERSLQIARNGFYKADQLKNLSDYMREKYFDRVAEGYEIKRKVRNTVLFTRHDVTENPPFIRLDLLVCRNLMIYFNSGLQQEIMKLFSYALNPGGLLFMGKSENAGDLDYFKKVDSRNKIFIRSDGEPIHGHRHSKPFQKIEKEHTKYTDSRNMEIHLRDIVKETLLITYEHPFLIVDDQNKIREIYGSVRLFLELKDGDMNADLVKMINPEMQFDLRAMLVKVKKQQEILKSRIIQFKVLEKEYFVRLIVKPLLHLYGKNQFYMVIFEMQDKSPAYSITDKNLPDIKYAEYKIHELEEELAISRDHLQTFTEELETSNEELQATNEELQSANEELKSGNEELETANEELQSSNEELTTTNSELRKSNETLLEKENDLQKLNEQLQESESRFKYLADHAPVMIWVTGQDELGNYFNKKWLEFIGLDLHQMNRDERFDLIHPDDRGQIRQAFQTAEREKKQFQYECRIRTKNGTYKWIQMNGIPRISPNGELIGYIGASSDIHEIKLLEKKKDEFMSIAGHELKTPMTTAMAYLQLMEEEIKKLENVDLSYYQEKMIRSMQKMHTLIIDLLEVNRIEADRLNLDLETIDFDTLVYDFVEEYERIIPDRKLNITGHTRSRIEGDKHRLEQVINNLLSNAAKFSPEDKKIEIQLKRKKQSVELIVKDHGIGIPEEYHGKLFSRFFQIGEGNYKSGMGVGLFICKEVIDRHHGNIKVVSEVGKGSSFIVKIPALE